MGAGSSALSSGRLAATEAAPELAGAREEAIDVQVRPGC